MGCIFIGPTQSQLCSTINISSNFPIKEIRRQLNTCLPHGWGIGKGDEIKRIWESGMISWEMVAFYNYCGNFSTRYIYENQDIGQEKNL